MLQSKVNKIMNSTLARNKKELDAAQITPFCDELQFGKNGLYLFIAPQGGGKSYNIAKFILMTENLSTTPYYNTIIYCSTSDGLDKTLDVFRKKFKTDVKYIDEQRLLLYMGKKSLFHRDEKFPNP